MHTFDHISAEDRGLNRRHLAKQKGTEHEVASAGGAQQRTASRSASAALDCAPRHAAAPQFEHHPIAWTGTSGSRSLQ